MLTGFPIAFAEEVTADALPSDSWFDSYHSYSDHLSFLEDLQSAFPQNSEILEIGASYEGRQITGLHLWGSGGSGSKPAVYIHGTVHAREWIATMVSSLRSEQPRVSGPLTGD